MYLFIYLHILLLCYGQQIVLQHITIFLVGKTNILP